MKKISFINVRGIAAAVVLVVSMPAFAGLDGWCDWGKSLLGYAPAPVVTAPVVVAPVLSKWQKIGNGLANCGTSLVNGGKYCSNAIVNGGKYVAKSKVAQSTMNAVSKVSSQAKAHPVITAAVLTSVAAATVAGLGYRWYTRHMVTKDEVTCAKAVAKLAQKDMANLDNAVKNVKSPVAQIKATENPSIKNQAIPKGHTRLCTLVDTFLIEYWKQRSNAVYKKNPAAYNTKEMTNIIAQMNALEVTKTATK